MENDEGSKLENGLETGEEQDRQLVARFSTIAQTLLKNSIPLEGSGYLISLDKLKKLGVGLDTLDMGSEFLVTKMRGDIYVLDTDRRLEFQITKRGGTELNGYSSLLDSMLNISQKSKAQDPAYG